MKITPFYPKMEQAQDAFKDAFEGWTVLEVGMTQKCTSTDSEGESGIRSLEGGLTFILQRDGLKKRVILGYNERSQWIEFEGFI